MSEFVILGVRRRAVCAGARMVWRSAVFAILLSLPPVVSAWTNDDLLVYSDQRNNGWDDWGWVAHYATNNPVHSGSNSMCLAPTGGWQAWWLVHDNIDTSLYTNVTFWLNGGSIGGQTVGINAMLGGAGGTRINVTAPTNAWKLFTISLASLGAADKTNFNGLQFWSNTGSTQPAFFLDDITLVAKPPPAVVHVGVTATQAVRTVDAKVFGINQVAWDGNVFTPTSVQIMNDLGNPCLRWPGGSWGDGYHWTNEYRGWGSYSSDFIKLATNTHAQAFIIVNYGSSSAEEAAYGVRMFNGTNRCNFKYWEVGNECGGSWETDNNTNAPWQPHDPWTYAMRFTNYYAQMKAADPTIKVGAVADITEDGTSNYTNHPVVNPRTGVTHNGWTPVMLTYMRSNHVLPDFLVEHKYPPSGGDTYNLLWSSTWSSDVASLRQMVSDYLDYVGYAGSNITLECTENGSPGDPQSVSLVGGLCYADSLGQVLQTELNSRLWWDTRNNGPDGGSVTNSDPALYGWRTNRYGYFYQDGGIVYNAGAPTNRYPKYYVAKLMPHFAAGGDTVVRATTDYPLLATYAVRRTNGSLSLLTINKSAAANLTASFNVQGFVPSAAATSWSYGKAQDDAARTNGPAQDIAQSSISNAGTSFTGVFPPYSVTVLSLAPAPPRLVALPSPPGQFVFQLQGQPGVPYVLQSTTDLSAPWQSVATNTLIGSTLTVTNPAPTSVPRQWWRALWRP